MYRFAGFELDEQRAELRGPQGATIRLRPKTFEMLRLFAANPGRVLSKRELMEAVWPDVHVGEDSLFQCIREIRAALTRMDDGSYGICGDCGTDIPLARLQVQPAALRCIACQERYEARHPAEVRAIFAT